MKAFHVTGGKWPEESRIVVRPVVEPDEDRWSAYCPALLKQGAATWGNTKEEALKYIDEVVHLIVAELIEEGESIPKDVSVSREPLVSVTVQEVWSGHISDH